MSKGTILYVGGFELPDKNAAAHRVLSNGKIFRELGYDVVFIDIDKSLKFNSNILETKKSIQGFECWSRPYPKSNNEWINYLTNIDSIKLISDRYEQVKAIIAYNYQAIALYKLRNFCHKHNIKIIADCTEWYSTKGSNIVFKIIKGLDSFLRMRIIQKRLDGLIVISKYLENYYRNCNNVIRIPPLVDLNEEKWNAVTTEYSDNKLRFIYSGSPGKNKDKLNLLLETLYELKEHDNYVLNIVGITEEQYIYDYPDHKELLNALGERVKFLGRLSHIDSIKALKNSDFSVFIREDTRLTKAGFPTKFVESISCGVPVITTNTSDLKDYLYEGENGFFINQDANISIEKLKNILYIDKNDVLKMKRNCYKYNVFFYRNYLSECKEFLESIINF
ncbi:glycosyltransferase [Thermoanaerobacterium butyriciformans]|uniref:Glycosyltransferase involved in cell wall biosynthesis n=1 Tax=Thermoanaerobacterium butyriciformans TaxID=1702242 RepID=A0ABS4NBV7_9THEO|nr:glycosyltransferase [Thermoanaerobacterium butyriciformans]MBP2070684.1 glycosyltransferase involved in cell wall biosynthesis [Thermoanaerobacterium butyriciformans]